MIFYTRHQEDIDGGEWFEYRAHFERGELTQIVRVEADEFDRRYYGLASFRWFDAPGLLSR